MSRNCHSASLSLQHHSPAKTSQASTHLIVQHPKDVSNSRDLLDHRRRNRASELLSSAARFFLQDMRHHSDAVPVASRPNRHLHREAYHTPSWSVADPDALFDRQHSPHYSNHSKRYRHDSAQHLHSVVSHAVHDLPE